MNVHTRFSTTSQIRSIIEFACRFSVVAHLDFITYQFLLNCFVNAWPRNSFPRSYIIIVGLRYLHNHVCCTRFAIIAACLSLYYIISNHPVAGYIIMNDFSMRDLSWPSPPILYRIRICTNNLSQGMAAASLADKSHF